MCTYRNPRGIFCETQFRIKVWLEESFTDDDLETQDVLISHDVAQIGEFRRQLVAEYNKKGHKDKCMKQTDESTHYSPK